MINYNSNLINGKLIEIEANDRAFAYADAVFETILFHHNELPLLQFHFQRLQHSAEIMQWENCFSSLDQFRAEMWKLIQHSKVGALESARIKVLVWRNQGGRYSPTHNGTSFLMIIEPIELANNIVSKEAMVSKTVFLDNSIFSSLKRTACTEYILAGIELQKADADEILIPHKSGFLAEALASNLFLCEDGILYTPPLSSGCVNGSSRRLMHELAKQLGYELQEKEIKIENLKKESLLFATNALGISHIKSVEGKQLQQDFSELYIFRKKGWLY